MADRNAMRAVTPARVDRSHYFEGYDNANRFTSYWHQIAETTAAGGNVVEIGVGNGTVAAVLRARGLNVTTVDIDPALNPDVRADIRELPFATKSFDTALAAEVLEHMPWASVPRALSELARVTRRSIVLSVPNADVALTIEARLPNAVQIARMTARGRLPLRHAAWALLQRGAWRRSGGNVEFLAQAQRLNRESLKCGEHYWELGARNIGRDDFVTLVERAGLRLVRDYRAPRFPIHHFFVLSTVDEARE